MLARALREDLHQPLGVGEDQLRDAPELERESGVEHVARGQAVVDPAARWSGRGGEHVDERRNVVIGDLLPLGDRLDA